MIDDQLGDLSLEVAFNRITVLYKEAFLRHMERLDESIKGTLNGKSKYNLQYFFRRAEILVSFLPKWDKSVSYGKLPVGTRTGVRKR